MEIKLNLPKLRNTWFARHWHWLILATFAIIYYWNAINSSFANNEAANQIFHQKESLIDSTHNISKNQIDIYYSLTEAQLKLDYDSEKLQAIKISLAPLIAIALSLLCVPMILDSFTKFNFLETMLDKEHPAQSNVLTMSIVLFCVMTEIFYISIILPELIKK